MPKQTQIVERHVIGTFGTQSADLRLWREPPHRVFANLPRFDVIASGKLALLDDTFRLPRRDAAGNVLPELVEIGAMEAFVRKHGVFPGSDYADEIDRFDVDAADFTDAQDTLRRAWAGDGDAMNEIESQVQYALEARAFVKARGVEVIIGNLWGLIGVLFLVDHAAGKTGVCGNPECPAPYFLRKRKDQKYCERGKCSTYAQRKYALGWWERKGYDLRARKSKRSKRRK